MERLWGYAKRYKKGFFILFILSILNAVLAIISPWLFSLVIDLGILKGDLSNTLMLAGAIILCAIFIYLVAYYRTAYLRDLTANIKACIKKDVFRHVLTFDFSNLDMFPTSKILTRINSDSEKLGQIINNIGSAFSNMMIFIVTTIICIKISPTLTGYLFMSFPFIFLILIVFFKYSVPVFKSVQGLIDKYSKFIAENVRSIRTIKTYTKEGAMEKAFKPLNYDLYRTLVKVVLLLVMIPSTFMFIMNIIILITILGGGNLVIKEQLSVGNFVAFFSYSTVLLASSLFFADIVGQLLPSGVSGKRIDQIMNIKPFVQYKEDSFGYIGKKDITFSNVSFAYPNSQELALKDISVTIPYGSSVGIIGPTASGKSTICNLLSRMYDPTSGSIKFGDVDLKDFSQNAIQEEISYVLQENILLMGSVKYNLAFAKAGASKEDMINALKLACIYDILVPKGLLLAPVDINGKNFSGGQKQRLTIARSLLKDFNYLILDNSTSALDTITEKTILNNIKNNFGQITMFIVSQKVQSIKNCDLIIYMDKGSIMALGTHNELLNTCPPYAKLYMQQNGGENE